jgi:zinc transport system ATP-binding protein
MSEAARSTPTAVEIVDVRFGYGATPVIDGLSCTIASGEFVAIAGANGAGKSTLLHLILGLYRPQAGTIRLLGGPPQRLARAGGLGYVPQRRVLTEVLPATVSEVVTSGLLTRSTWWHRPSEAARAATGRALDAVGLRERAADHFQSLSGGQQQRVLIAKALVAAPEVLVLDEPLAGVDDESQHKIAFVLRERADQGAAVVVVSHELEVLDPVVDRMLLLAGGRITFDGALADLPIHRHGHGHW